LQACYSFQRKAQPVSQIAWDPCDHLGLVPGAAVVSRHEMVAVHGEHRDHSWLISRLRFGHQGTSIGSKRVSFCYRNTVLNRFPRAHERSELLEHSLALALILGLRLRWQRDCAGHGDDDA